jgi:hypothetical protein
MATYHFAEELASPRNVVRDSLVFTTVWLSGFAVFERLVNGHWGPPLALAGGGALCFLASALTNFLRPRKTQRFELEIDDEGIRCLWNGEVVRNVQRDRVGYVREHRSVFGRKLVVSEHGFLMARLHRVNVPERLLEREQYERIKAQAHAWLKTGHE